MGKTHHLQKHTTFERHGDIIEVVIRDSSFTKIFEKEASVHNRKELEKLLYELKSKGVDLVGIIRKKMITDSDWFG